MRVPVYERQSTQLRGGDNVPRATDEAFGAGIGRATSMLGTAIATTGQAFGSALQQNQNEQDAITAKIVSAEYEADVQNHSNNLMLNGDPANASMVPGQVQEYAERRKAEYLPRVSGRYQNHFNLSATQSAMAQGIKTNVWATKTSADYEGKRVTEITGKQSAYLLEAPDQLPRATQAVRGVIDEMNAPEWRKNQLREQAAIELMAPVKDGYLKRADALEEKGDFKGAAAARKEGKETILRLNTEMPMLMGVKPLPAAVGPRVQLAPHDRDAAIKTIWGEARGESPDGQAAVAEIIRNRAIKSGQTATEVVMAKGQFEPWSRPEVVAEMNALKPGDPKYDAIGRIVDGVFGGEVPDKTAGGTHFYSPTAQAALGRKPPAWATPQTKVASLGTHEFYAPEGAVPSLGLTPKPVGGGNIQTGGAIVDQGRRPDRYEGTVQMGGVKVSYVSGGGKTPSAPYGTYPITPEDNGTIIKRLGGFTLNGNAMYDPQLGRNRLGIAIHPGENSSAGCIAIPYAQWPQFKAALLNKMETEGRQYLTINKDGSAYIHSAGAAPEGKQQQVALAAQATNTATDAGPVGERPVQVAQAGVPTPGTGATMAGSAGSANYTKFMRDAMHAFDQGNGRLSVAQKNAQNNLNVDLTSEEESIRQRGGSGKVVSDEKINGAFDPPQIEQIRQTREANMDYNSATSGWSAKTPAEREADLERLNPANAPVGPDYKYRMENFVRAQRQHENMTVKQSNAAAVKYAEQFADAEAGRGPVPDYDRIKNDPTLNDEQRVRLLSQHNKTVVNDTEYKVFNARLSNGGFINPSDKNDQKFLDRKFDEMGGRVEDAQTLLTQTNHIPPKFGTMIHGALMSGDPKMTQGALQLAGNVIAASKNGQGFAGSGEKTALEAAGTYFNRQIELGKKPEQAVADWMEQQKPTNQTAALKRAKDEIPAQLKKQVTVEKLAGYFDPSLLGLAPNPQVGYDVKSRDALHSDFQDVAAEKYEKTNGDWKLAMDQAAVQLKGVWGVSESNGKKILTRWPPENNNGFQNVENASEIIANQALEGIRTQPHGAKAERKTLQFIPTDDTPKRVLSGLPGQYKVTWEDEYGNRQTSLGVFESDAKSAQAEKIAKKKEILDKGNAARDIPPDITQAVPAPVFTTPVAGSRAGGSKPEPPPVKPPDSPVTSPVPDPTGFNVPSAGSRAGGSKKKPGGGFTAE